MCEEDASLIPEFASPALPSEPASSAQTRQRKTAFQLAGIAVVGLSFGWAYHMTCVTSPSVPKTNTTDSYTKEFENCDFEGVHRTMVCPDHARCAISGGSHNEAVCGHFSRCASSGTHNSAVCKDYSTCGINGGSHNTAVCQKYGLCWISGGEHNEVVCGDHSICVYFPGSAVTAHNTMVCQSSLCVAYLDSTRDFHNTIQCAGYRKISYTEKMVEASLRTLNDHPEWLQYLTDFWQHVFSGPLSDTLPEERQVCMLHVIERTMGCDSTRTLRQQICAAYKLCHRDRRLSSPLRSPNVTAGRLLDEDVVCETECQSSCELPRCCPCLQDAQPSSACTA